MTSATERTIALLKSRGGKVFKTEHWNPYAHIRQDLMGFCDMLYIGKMTPQQSYPNIIAVQSTTGSGHAEHKRKILESDNYGPWRAAGGLVLLISWSKRKYKRGSKMYIWTPREEYL